MSGIFNRSNDMHNISMFLLPVLLLLLLSSPTFCGAQTMESPPTYNRVDPSTGKILICDKCPPGTHMAAHCTATTRTKCLPCGDDHFTELWNYLPKCLYCSNFCYQNQEVEKECSPTSNRVCRCKEGFYWSDDFCIPHSKCEHGYGVQTKGTSITNTVCERCADGYFSNSFSALDQCVKHQECAVEQIVFLNGTTNHDTVCGNCGDVANGGEAYRTLISTLLSTHRMGAKKMKRFVARYVDKSVTRRALRCAPPNSESGPLLGKIQGWVATASKEQLKNLPKLLRSTQLNSVAQKLETTLVEIEQQTPNCTPV